LALTEWDNTPLGNLADGFFEQGQGNFTSTFTDCSQFGDVTNNCRDGHWAVDIIGFSTPEPCTLLLLLPGMLSVVARRLRRMS
jgi:hypothetical protein